MSEVQREKTAVYVLIGRVADNKHQTGAGDMEEEVSGSVCFIIMSST